MCILGLRTVAPKQVRRSIRDKFDNLTSEESTTERIAEMKIVGHSCGLKGEHETDSEGRG